MIDYLSMIICLVIHELQKLFAFLTLSQRTFGDVTPVIEAVGDNVAYWCDWDPTISRFIYFS